MFYVYVLRSRKNNYRYIGQINDIERRLKEHNEGLTKSIRFQRPFVLEYYERCQSRCAAIKKEKFFKSGKGREWLNNRKNIGL